MLTKVGLCEAAIKVVLSERTTPSSIGVALEYYTEQSMKMSCAFISPVHSFDAEL